MSAGIFDVALFRERMALAYCGHSQYGPRDISRALMGHMRNGGLTYDAALAAATEIAALEGERWDTWTPDDVMRCEREIRAGLSQVRP